ncbi:MAG: SDR family oxidoreductase [Proteobacteria bacterium]|nr:SDR family oxidoreductase [Pseudomonadota bacterium]HQR03070.1 SDR family oxidoreductase [Rhodocyclaceae bacterium]
MSRRNLAVMFDFRNTDVVVTGGTSGIGLAIASSFLAAGANVLVTGTRAQASDYDHLPASFRYLQLHLEQPESVERFIAAVPGVDFLVNNAGHTMPGAGFADTIQVNLNAVHAISTGLHAKLARADLDSGAGVVNLASMMSFFGSPYFAGYGAAKAGIVQLTKTFSMAWARDGIRVNAVAPGSIPTSMTAAYANDPAVHQMVCDKTPMARWGTAEEIAQAVLFLCSPGASFITGHTLVVDGGYSIAE